MFLWNHPNYIQNPTKNKEDYGNNYNFGRIQQNKKWFLDKIHKITLLKQREATEIKSKNCYKSTKERGKMQQKS